MLEVYLIHRHTQNTLLLIHYPHYIPRRIPMTSPSHPMPQAMASLGCAALPVASATCEICEVCGSNAATWCHLGVSVNGGYPKMDDS